MCAYASEWHLAAFQAQLHRCVGSLRAVDCKSTRYGLAVCQATVLLLAPQPTKKKRLGAGIRPRSRLEHCSAGDFIFAGCEGNLHAFCEGLYHGAWGLDAVFGGLQQGLSAALSSASVVRPRCDLGGERRSSYFAAEKCDLHVAAHGKRALHICW
jgi:hypothetical protein